MWPETDLVNYHWPRSMSLTLAWQLSKLIYYIYICSNNQLHTPASDLERQAEEERDSLKPLIKMQSVIQIWTFVHINFIYSQYMRFEQLHERGLFCVKIMFFLLFVLFCFLVTPNVLLFTFSGIDGWWILCVETVCFPEIWLPKEQKGITAEITTNYIRWLQFASSKF